MDTEVLNIPVKQNKPAYFLRVLEKNRFYHYNHPTVNFQVYGNPDKEFLFSMLLAFAIALINLQKRRKLHAPAPDYFFKKISNSNSFFQIESLIEKNYDIEIKVKKEKIKNTSTSFLRKKYFHLPIVWGKGKCSIEDFAGIWAGRNIKLEEIRKGAWKRI